MDNDDQTETACELFEQYAALLNREFHDDDTTEKITLECIMIAKKLIELGFVIVANILHNMETISLSDDGTQTILTFTYELILVPNQISFQEPVEPVASTCAVAKIFGLPTTQVKRGHIHPAISPKDEAWLHRILDDLGADKPDKNSSNKKEG